MKISVVIPVYESAATIRKLVDELIINLRLHELEIILVNDGSSDNSHDECILAFKKYPDIIRYIWLTKNFGEHNAVLAGLNNVTGDYAVIIDDDFQNPPEEINKLINEAIQHKYDVVYSHYTKKQHSRFRNFGSWFNNLVATWLLNKPRYLYLSSFKCLNRFIIQEIIKYKGPFPYIDGLILRSTRNIGKVLIQHDKRRKGKSNYTFKKLIMLWFNMFVNFSINPLRLSTILGFSLFVIGFILSFYSIIEKILNPGIPMGVTSIFVAILLLSGIQMLMLGVLGEYLGKLLLADNQTPQFVVRTIFTGETKDKKNEKIYEKI